MLKATGSTIPTTTHKVFKHRRTQPATELNIQKTYIQLSKMRSKQLLPDLMLGRMGRDAGESQMECKRMLPLEVGL